VLFRSCAGRNRASHTREDECRVGSFWAKVLRPLCAAVSGTPRDTATRVPLKNPLGPTTIARDPLGGQGVSDRRPLGEVGLSIVPDSTLHFKKHRSSVEGGRFHLGAEKNPQVPVRSSLAWEAGLDLWILLIVNRFVQFLLFKMPQRLRWVRNRVAPSQLGVLVIPPSVSQLATVPSFGLPLALGSFWHHWFTSGFSDVRMPDEHRYRASLHAQLSEGPWWPTDRFRLLHREFLSWTSGLVFLVDGYPQSWSNLFVSIFFGTVCLSSCFSTGFFS